MNDAFVRTRVSESSRALDFRRLQLIKERRLELYRQQREHYGSSSAVVTELTALAAKEDAILERASRARNILAAA